MKPRAQAHVLEPIELGLPLARYRDAFAAGRGGFVLDGGDFSMLGGEPFLAFRAFRALRSERLPSGALGARVVIEERGAVVRAEVDDPLEVLRALLREYGVAPQVLAERPMPMPLCGGAVGYIGYETGQMLERLPCVEREAIGLPDVAFFFHDWVLGTCRRTGRSWLSVIGRGETAEEARALAEKTRERVTHVLASFEAGAHGRDADVRDRDVQARDKERAFVRHVVSREDYITKIGTAKEHILRGDSFEICLTHRMDAQLAEDPFTLWRRLVTANPAPFSAFLDLPEGAIASSSPERFLSLSAARVVESRPIKGTRPRSADPAEDARLARDLASAEKDRAENAMIVDLVRNDLGRVCRYGSVEVPELYAVESYATVHQLVSTVRGELDAGRDAIDLVRACFPPGSMTGAPKIEAMTILERLEPTERGVYSGALGWFDFSGPLDLSVVIRTIVVKDGHAHLHVGGAIVADSDPAAEHDETMHKARALIDAIGHAP